MATKTKAGTAGQSAGVPERITQPLDLNSALSHLFDIAQPHVSEARAEWFAEQLPTLTDQVALQASTLCELLAETAEGAHAVEHGFYLMGNLFSLLAGLSNVGHEMAFTHQRLKAKRLQGAAE